MQIYLLSNKAQYMVDDTFNKIHKQSHLEYTIDLTLLSFLVFVIYKTNSHDKKKGYAVIDIQKLNDLVLHDFYLFSLQLKIIANV